MQRKLNDKNSFEFSKTQKQLKEINEKKLLKQLFEKHLPKKRSQFISLISEKYGYDIAKKLQNEADDIFYEFYDKKK